MIDQSAVQIVLSNPSLLAKLLSFVRYDHLQECRLVNKLWRFEATKILRCLTRVCVNNLNLELMLASNTVLGFSLHIRWLPVMTVSLKTLFQKYCRYIRCLSWFMDGSGRQGIAQNRESTPLLTLIRLKFIHVVFPSLKELNFLIACPPSQNREALALIEAIFEKCPDVEALKLEILDSSFKLANILKAIVKQKLTKLSSIHLGESVKLYPSDLIFLTNMEPNLKSLSWEGSIPLEDGIDMFAYDDAFLGAGCQEFDTLRIAGLTRHVIPPKQFALRKLSLSNVNFMTIVPLSKQFAMLEDLSFSFENGFNWESWIPQDMAPHPSLKSLQWLDKGPLSSSAMQCLLRLFGKLPHLENLACTATDKFLEQIVLKVPNLRKLKLSGDCSDFGVTGIPEMYCSVINNLLKSGHLKKTRHVLRPYRQRPNICDLHKLEELTFMHTKITDEAICLAICVMDLKKVYVTGVSLDAITELCKNTSIQEIGIPQPLEGKIRHEEISLLKKKIPNIKIVSGWDSADFPLKLLNN